MIMFRKNKLSIILSTLCVLLPIVVGLLLWNKLPAQIPTHFNIRGEADRISSKSFAIFVPCLFMLAVHILGITFCLKDNSKNEQNEKILSLAVWIVPAISIAVYSAIYSQALGFGFPVISVISVLIGIVFLVVGNYMPKAKRNRTIGVRVKWTLEDDDNWYATHRFAGKLLFFSGIAFLICAFLPNEVAGAIILPVLLIAGFAPVVYSYLYYKKHK